MKATDPAPRGPAGAQWTSRSIGSNFQHTFFYLLIRFGGRRSAYCFLTVVVLCYVLFKPSVREKADYYLARRLKRKHRLERFADRYLIYLNLGKTLIDRAVIGILGDEKIAMQFEGRERLLDLLNEKKGLILMTAHVGCWQTAMAALRFFHVPVHLLLQREEGDIDLHYFEHAGIASPYRFIDPTGYMGGVLEIMEVLKKGEVLCVMGDRLFGTNKGAVAIDFLGGKASFPFSSFKIASATGAPIVVFFSYKSSPTTYTLEIARIIRVPRDTGKRAKDYLPYVGEFAQALESYTTAHPYQFFNFYDMWEG